MCATSAHNFIILDPSYRHHTQRPKEITDTIKVVWFWQERCRATLSKCYFLLISEPFITSSRLLRTDPQRPLLHFHWPRRPDRQPRRLWLLVWMYTSLHVRTPYILRPHYVRGALRSSSCSTSPLDRLPTANADQTLWQPSSRSQALGIPAPWALVWHFPTTQERPGILGLANEDPGLLAATLSRLLARSEVSVSA